MVSGGGLRVTAMKISASSAAFFLRLIILVCFIACLTQARKRKPIRKKAQHCSKGTHNCHKDATCTDTRKSFRCKCRPGFHGDGKICKDEDECLYDNGGCVHDCHNTQGSFHCSCKNGFELMTDKKNCKDINECFDKKGGCSHHCNNNVGSYECGCSKGFSVDIKGKTCVYDEWCKIKFGCTHGCRSSVKSNKMKCYCRNGFYLHSDDKTCLRTCANGNGGCHHICTDSDKGPKCSCSEKYFLHSDNVTCIASCLIDNGGCERKCIDTADGPMCSCPSGFRLHQDGKACLDIDECATGEAGCSHECVNTQGSFECICPSGFKVGTNDKTCIDINECQVEDICDHECENTPGSFMCHCRQGYKKFGITHCADDNECAVRHGGCAHSCTNHEGGYQCSCVPGYKLHPNKHDCIDAHQCTKLRPLADLRLECQTTFSGDQSCRVQCRGKGYLVTQGSLLQSAVVNVTCGPSTRYQWHGLEQDQLPQCSKLVVPASYQRVARVVLLRESCNFDQHRLEEVRSDLTKTFNSGKKYKCNNRCHVTYFDLRCGARRKKFKKLMRRTKKYILTAEFELRMESKKLSGKCDAFCSAEKNWKKFNRTFKRLRRTVKRNKFTLKIQGETYKAIKKSLKADKLIQSICPEGTEFINKTCVGCLPGTAYGKANKTCEPCPKGTYQDSHGSLECKPCPGTTPGSGREAADSLQDCYDLCEPGTFSPLGTKPCQKCGIGTFQPSFGRITCIPCGGGLSTITTGSKDFIQCKAKVECQPGFYYSTISRTCVTCGPGFFQPIPGQEFCYACPGQTTTDFSGATSSEACKDRTCRQIMGDYYGVLETPNYPGNYPINVECVWKIKPEKKRRILIIVPEIDLDSGDKCGDRLVMRKSKSPYSEGTFETCKSRHRPRALTARSKKLWIQFTSDSNHTAKGFSIPFVTYNEEYQSLIEDIVKDGRLYNSQQHQQIFQDRQLLIALLEVIATPYSYLKYANVSHTMFPESFFRLLTPKVRRFFRT